MEYPSVALDPVNFFFTCDDLSLTLSQWLEDHGVETDRSPARDRDLWKVAYGDCADDGWFEPHSIGPECLAIPVDDGHGITDVCFWEPLSNRTARLLKAGFALGEDQIDNPGVYSFGGHLCIHADPLQWLQSGCDGIVVLDWGRAFDRLRQCPRVAVHPSILITFREAMEVKPSPELFVMADEDEGIAT